MLRPNAFAALALAALAACSDSPTGRGNDARVQVRFGVAGAQGAQALLQTSGTDQLAPTAPWPSAPSAWSSPSSSWTATAT